MTHQMKLYDGYFQAIKEGKKTVEIGLNDKKRRNIRVGDSIEFIKIPQQDEIIKVKIHELRKYDIFEAMYKDIPFKVFDCEGWTMKKMIIMNVILQIL